MGHAEDFVHAWSDGINRGGATDFVVEFRGEFFAPFDDLLAFFAVRIPGVFLLSAGFLAESRECDLGETVFDDFVAGLELFLFPESEFFGGFLDGFGDFLDLLACEGEIIDALPVVRGIGDSVVFDIL